MWETLEKIFDEIGLPYFRQGSFSETDKLPDSFFTFWNVATLDNSYYNNNNIRTIYEWAIYFYTNNANIIYSKMNEFINLAKENGFIIDGNGNDINSNEVNYFGRYVLITYPVNNIN